MTPIIDVDIKMRFDLDEKTGIRVRRAFDTASEPPGYFGRICISGPVFEADSEGHFGRFARSLDTECQGLARDITSRTTIATKNGAVVVDAAGALVHVTKEWHPVVVIARFIGTQALADLIRAHAVTFLEELSQL